MSMFKDQLQRFRRDEDGAIIVFALILFVLMIMVGGMAVDIMRYEATRVTLQQTLDRSTLAAAAMDQQLDPASVVTDYMDKAGLADQLDRVTVTNNATYRSVVAKGKIDIRPFFMQFMGIHNLPARAVSGAEQGVDNLEISLVLDVSGSMSGQKIIDLRAAAAEFATNMLQNDPFDRVSIAIVPYNAQVNLGAPLLAKFKVTHQNGVANVDCVELPDAAYAMPAVPRDLALPKYAYADATGSTNYVDAAVSPIHAGSALPNLTGSSYCRANQENVVRLPSNDLPTIISQINALTAGGNTSITLGMKWGLTMLDPSMNSAFAEFAAVGQMDAALSDRPYAYRSETTQKVVILMTDGEHVAHTRVTDGYKTGPSPIWKAPNGRYSVYKPTIAGPNKYYVPHLDSFQAGPFAGGGAAVQQNWETVWSQLRVSYVAWQFNARAMSNDWNGQVTAFYDWYNAMVGTWKSRDEMDAMLQTTCGQARDSGVVVYGIAFQAPQGGRTQISNCATTPANYYDATDGDRLRAAFRQIATNLTQLRLTQ